MIKIIRAISDKKNVDLFGFHIAKVGQQFGGDEKILACVISRRATGLPARVRNNATKDKALIAFIKSLINLILVAVGRKKMVRTQMHNSERKEKTQPPLFLPTHRKGATIMSCNAIRYMIVLTDLSPPE